MKKAKSKSDSKTSINPKLESTKQSKNELQKITKTFMDEGKKLKAKKETEKNSLSFKELEFEQLRKFQCIKSMFLEGTKPKFPEAEKWKSMSKDAIWLRIVSQIVVVGKEAPAQHLQEPCIQQGLALANLVNKKTDKQAEALGKVLAKIKTRYVSKKNPKKSPKVIALLKNLKFLKEHHPDGPRSLINHLAGMETISQQIEYLSNNFSYFKAKGARDFLTTGLGMTTEVIALDIRVMGIVRLIIPNFPKKVNQSNYEAIESFLIEHVCKPLKISAMEFDQLLFHNKSEIEKYLCSSNGNQRSKTVRPSVCRSRKPSRSDGTSIEVLKVKDQLSTMLDTTFS